MEEIVKYGRNYGMEEIVGEELQWNDFQEAARSKGRIVLTNCKKEPTQIS